MPRSQPDHNQPFLIITKLQSTKQYTQPKNTTQPDQNQPFLITGATPILLLLEETKAYSQFFKNFGSIILGIKFSIE